MQRRYVVGLVGHAGPIYRAIKFIPIIQPLQKELQNLEDASGDIMLLDDDQSIPYPPHYCMSQFLACTAVAIT